MIWYAYRLWTFLQSKSFGAHNKKPLTHRTKTDFYEFYTIEHKFLCSYRHFSIIIEEKYCQYRNIRNWPWYKFVSTLKRNAQICKVFSSFNIRKSYHSVWFDGQHVLESDVDSLWSPGWPGTQKSTCFCFSNVKWWDESLAALFLILFIIT